MNADLEKLKAEHAEYLQLVRLKDFMAAVNDLLDEKDAKLEALREIVACFREGDASGLRSLIDWLDAMQKTSDFIIHPDHMQRLVRMQAAAKLAEDLG